MSFSFTQEAVYQCRECGYCSTKRHFLDNKECVLCSGTAQQIETINQETGVPSFKWRQTLDSLEGEARGVGQATVDRIDDTFDKDEFFDVCEDAYTEREYDELTEVDGIGQSTAETITEHLAEREDWDRPTFDLQS